MEFEIEKIFAPSCGIDLVFNLSSLTPYSRSSIIYDVNHDTREIIVAQPHVKFTENTEFDELHITTIKLHDNKKTRLGLGCTPVQILSQYRLANRNTAEAIQLRYSGNITEANIRAAFRLSLSAKFAVKGKITIRGQELFSPKDFSIRDISLNGIGIVIPKKVAQVHGLLDIERGNEMALALILMNLEQGKPMGTVPVGAKIARVNQNYSPSHIFAGCQFVNITTETDSLLNQFIHTAQIDELQKLSGI